MDNQVEKTNFDKFLDEQTAPRKPTPKDIEWARKRFSSRAEPPKS